MECGWVGIRMTQDHQAGVSGAMICGRPGILRFIDTKQTETQRQERNNKPKLKPGRETAEAPWGGMDGWWVGEQ